jgi:hypothetical protein
MKHSLLRAWLTAALMVAVASASAFAQGGTTATLSGVVVDGSGAVIPGATVEAKNNATSAVSTAVSSDEGTFAIPALNSGIYTVTVTLQGFKTYKAEKVELSPGVGASIRAVLEVGGLEETVVVSGGTELMQTASPTVSKTMNANQIGKLPLVSRNALDAVVFLPGVNTPSGNRDSTVNGLPQGAINITLDGMSIQDNYLKTDDGFFARLSPRLDAVEAVTVTTAAQGAESSGQGAVQIKFVTRSGTNNYTGSGYMYFRHDALNSNTWFNNRDLAPVDGKAPKSELRQYQPGARFGGPIWIPGVYNGTNKAFFFVNYEQQRQPSKITRNRTILSTDAMNGVFRYTGGPAAGVNLFSLRNAEPIDPTVAGVLAAIRSASQQGAISDLTDPNVQRATFQLPTKSINHYPTSRIDYNLSDKHRITASFNYQHINSTPDTTNSREPVFPGFTHTASQQSTRWTTSESLRSTLTGTLVNEFRIGKTGGATYFSPELTAAMWGPDATPNQGGYRLDISGAASGISNPDSTSGISAREASTINAENTLNWVKGTHSFNFGSAWTQVDLWLRNQTLVPTIGFGIVSGDPADTIFNTTNFPGASNTVLNQARSLYAVLTGRVNAINGNIRLNEDTNKYEYLGTGMQRARMREMGFWAQDQWRWKPNFTINYGIRYELQFPFYPLNDSYLTASYESACGISGRATTGGCNVFQPGVTPGSPTQFVRFSKNERAFNTDYNNFAPNLGFAWTPHTEGGLFRSILGSAEGDTVIKAGYSIAYNRGGMSDFSDIYGANPGVSITTNRNSTLGNLADGGAFPILFSQTSRLAPPSFATELTLPFTNVPTGTVNMMDPDLQVPYAQTWTAGVQRKLTRDTALEVRYVGTRHLQGLTTYNYNEINIVENNFLNEFRTAQGNLKANQAAGLGNTFAYTGAAGTAPLPIFLAHYTGRNASLANNPANYTGTQWSSTTFVGYLAERNPQPYNFASTNGTNGLLGNATFRANAVAAGLPRNFWIANPDAIGGVNVTGNGGYTRYDSLQVDFRKRLSGGLQLDANYVFGEAYASSRFSFREPRVKRLDTGTPGGITHAFKMNWVYELPFGRGRRWMNNNNGFMERILGGWEFDGTSRIQSGRLVELGNVRLVGMSRDDVKDMFKLRFDDAGKVIYMLPQDVIDNTVKAFSVSATTANGYSAALGAPEGRYFAPANGPDCIEITGIGDCGVGTLVVTGPRLVRFDLSAVKRFDIRGRLNAEFRAEMLNAFNHPYFTPVGGLGNDPDNYRVTGADSGRTVQLVWRINW